MNKMMILASLIALGSLTACSRESEKSSFGYSSTDQAEAYDEFIPATTQSPPPPGQDHVYDETRKVIKTAHLRIQVDNLDSAKGNIDRLLKQYDAYASADNRVNDNYRLTLNMTIRVKQSSMENLLKALAAQASYVFENNIHAQDVTEEFVDLNIRLKNKRAVEEQYRELLKKASKIEDILKIENELRIIREEIEAKEGRLKYLQDQVALSTITLDAFQEIYQPNHAPQKSFGTRITEAFGGGWDLLKHIFLTLIYIWPVLLLLLLITYYIRRRSIFKKSKRD